LFNELISLFFANNLIAFSAMKIQKLRNTASLFAGITFANYNFSQSKRSQLIDTELGSSVKTIGGG
jgi:hypothetical protein